MQNLVISRSCFGRKRQRNVQRFIMHVQNHCFVIKLFIWWRFPCRRRGGLFKLPNNYLIMTILKRFVSSLSHQGPGK